MSGKREARGKRANAAARRCQSVIKLSI